jgi:hypothetical protein
MRQIAKALGQAQFVEAGAACRQVTRCQRQFPEAAEDVDAKALAGARRVAEVDAALVGEIPLLAGGQQGVSSRSWRVLPGLGRRRHGTVQAPARWPAARQMQIRRSGRPQRGEQGIENRVRIRWTGVGVGRGSDGSDLTCPAIRTGVRFRMALDCTEMSPLTGAAT